MDDPKPVLPTSPKSPQVEACKRDHRGDVLAYGMLILLAYVVTLIFAVVILQIKIDPVVLTLVSVAVTCVTSGVGIVLGFQFGSSQGSQDKNATLAAATTQGPTP